MADTPHEILSRIVGVTGTNPDGSRRQALIKKCKLGERLILEREPGNSSDPNAIRIHNLRGEQLGYVAARLATTLAPLIDQGDRVETEVFEFTGGGWFSRKAPGVIIIARILPTGNEEAPDETQA